MESFALKDIQVTCEPSSRRWLTSSDSILVPKSVAHVSGAEGMGDLRAAAILCSACARRSIRT